MAMAFVQLSSCAIVILCAAAADVAQPQSPAPAMMQQAQNCVVNVQPRTCHHPSRPLAHTDAWHGVAAHAALHVGLHPVAGMPSMQVMTGTNHALTLHQ